MATDVDGVMRDLAAAISGDVLLPGSADYERARRPSIAGFDHIRPAAVVQCATAGDVARTVSTAREAGLGVAARSGGHCFAGRSTASGLVIDLGRMDMIEASGTTAVVGAGVRLGALYASLGELGRTIPAGCGPTVGVSGLVLGGGVGVLGRAHGLTSDSLLAAEVVLADGSVVTCDDIENADLFWALRGAGHGAFGVVTSLTFRTLPSHETETFALTWPHTRAAAVIDAWQRWAPAAPDELFASLHVTVPRDVTRLPTVTVFGTVFGGAASALKESLRQLVATVGDEPAASVLRHSSVAAAKRYLADLFPSDAEGGGASPDLAISKSEFFRDALSVELCEELVAHLFADRVDGQWRQLDFMPWGGAFTRVPADATAFVHRSERFLLKQEVSSTDPALLGALGRDWLNRCWGLVHPAGTGGVYANFPDPTLPHEGRAYFGTNYERLLEIKRRYDPTNFFVSPVLNPADL